MQVDMQTKIYYNNAVNGTSLHRICNNTDASVGRETWASEKRAFAHVLARGAVTTLSRPPRDCGRSEATRLSTGLVARPPPVTIRPGARTCVPPRPPPIERYNCGRVLRTRANICLFFRSDRPSALKSSLDTAVVRTTEKNKTVTRRDGEKQKKFGVFRPNVSEKYDFDFEIIMPLFDGTRVVLYVLWYL